MITCKHQDCGKVIIGEMPVLDKGEYFHLSCWAKKQIDDGRSQYESALRVGALIAGRTVEDIEAAK